MKKVLVVGLVVSCMASASFAAGLPVAQVAPKGGAVMEVTSAAAAKVIARSMGLKAAAAAAIGKEKFDPNNKEDMDKLATAIKERSPKALEVKDAIAKEVQTAEARDSAVAGQEPTGAVVAKAGIQTPAQQVAFLRVVSLKNKAAGIKGAKAKAVFAGVKAFQGLGLIYPAGEECYSHYTQPKAIKVVADGFENAKGGTEVQLQTQFVDGAVADYPGEARETVIKDRICPAMDSPVPGSGCKIVNLGAFCK